MDDMFDRIRRTGWLLAEAGLLIVLICMLLNIILGGELGGGFVATVSSNANAFLRALPAGTVMGLALIVAVYWLVRPRLER